MKDAIRSLTAISAGTALALLSTATVCGEDAASGPKEKGHFYAGIDIGGNWTPNLALKEFFGPVASGSEVELDAGLRAGLRGGYQLTTWFAPEIEVGFLQNEIDRVTGGSRLKDAYFSNIPFFVNGRFQYPNSSRFVPFIGAGVGFSETILSARHMDLGGVKMDKNSSGADVVFAYQVFAGVRYEITKRISASLEYRFVGAGASDFEIEDSTGGVNDRVGFGRSETHAISAEFQYRF